MSNITIKNARLSFPNVFKKGEIDGKTVNKYDATLLIPKTDTKTYNMLLEKIDEIKAANKKAGLDNSDFDKFFIQDGDVIYRKKERDGYQGMWAIKASNSKRPTVLNRDKTPLVEEDEVIYAGCYVNGIINLWFQNNQYGMGVNANLLGVQFVKDGEAFGDGAKTAGVDEFDDIDDEDEF